MGWARIPARTCRDGAAKQHGAMAAQMPQPMQRSETVKRWMGSWVGGFVAGTTVVSCLWSGGPTTTAAGAAQGGADVLCPALLAAGAVAPAG